jgi:cyclophilin family peptidyl-prolyl cis-trans isomerase
MRFPTFAALAALALLALPLSVQAQATSPAPATVPSQAGPGVLPDPVAAPPLLPSVSVQLNERQQQVEVESLSNPLLILSTTRGDLLLELFPQEAPRTVENFLGLAEGTKPFIDPLTGAETQRPFYDGLIFHRVIAGFMIQGGSPTGTGEGTPGYSFADEIDASSLGLDKMLVLDVEGYPNPVLGIRSPEDFQQRVLMPLYQQMGIDSQSALDARVSEIDRRLRTMTVKEQLELLGYRYTTGLQSRAPVRGVIAMANSGPDSNGSQFFINLADTEWLLGRHTVFGKVRAGLEVLDAIGKVRVNSENRPQPDITILSLRRLGSDQVQPVPASAPRFE